MPGVATPAQGSSTATSATPAQTSLARGALVALLDEAATRATLAAHGEIVVVVAPSPSLGRVVAVARDAVESFTANTAATDDGRRLASMARTELREPHDAWVMFFARPTRGDDRARTLGVAATVAALRMSARWCGLSARAFSGAPLVTSRLCELLAGSSGSWFAGAELVAAVMLSTTGVSATIPPAVGMPSSFAVPTLWLGDGDRLDVTEADEQARAAREIPVEIRAEPDSCVVVCDTSHHRAAVIRALEAAGYRVETAEPAALVPRIARDAPALVVAQIDDPFVRAALPSLSARRDDVVVPLLAYSGCGHEDARLRAAQSGAIAFLSVPARPFDVARKAHELVAMKQLVDAARRQTAEVSRMQAELMRSERMATLGWLAASVGHDLRAPLAAIRSNSELALGAIARVLAGPAAASPDAQRALTALQDLERINAQAADRMAEIVAGLKAFARPDETAPARGNVGEVLEQVLSLCAQEVQNTRVRSQIEAGLPEVAVRHAELMQVLMNLLVNAAHAVPPGGTIEIHARREGATVALEVCDDGPGVAPEVRSKLFLPGFTTRGASGGTGLGLSIVKRIVDGAGGSIELQSDVAPGARFRVVLPVA